MKLQSVVFFSFLAGIILFSSCRKERLYKENDAIVEFSTDTVFFDTVFTTIGSSTRRLMIRNPYNQTIEIDRVWIASGKTSVFRMNVDGIPSKDVSNVNIAPKDSAFVFVEVTIDPSNANLPFVVNDSIYVSVNGNLQKINLVAWGQNAYYYRPTQQVSGLPSFSYLSEYGVSSTTVTWKNDKPHVIYGYLMVDSLLTLKIEEGTQIHLHKNSGLWVYRGGNIEAVGKTDNPIVFQGDRLENYWEDNAGQWDRIWINGSDKDQIFDNVIFKNGFVGIQFEPFPFKEFPDRPAGKLLIKNSIFQNFVGVGVLARNTKMKFENTVISNCGTNNLALLGGGDYEFIHCTFANYWTNGTRKDPLLVMTNYYEDLFGNEVYNKMDKAYFGNSIIYGSQEEEINFDFDEATGFDYFFDHCILRTETVFDSSFVNNIYQPEPFLVVDGVTQNAFFKDENEFNFDITEYSIARDLGSLSVTGTLLKDIRENDRSDGKPDLGAYEFKPE